MARSRALLGPYELHPDVHILSARHRPDVALQRAGHADLVETPVRRNLHGLSVRTAARQPRAVHARTRDRDSADDMERRRLAAHDDGRRHSDAWRCRRRAGLTPQPHPPDACSRGVRRATRCRSPFNGCDRRSPTSCSASASGRATCAFTVARRSAASSRRRSSPVVNSRIATARRRSSSSSPSTSSRWPASCATTTAPSSTTSTCRATRRAASTFA